MSSPQKISPVTKYRRVRSLATTILLTAISLRAAEPVEEGKENGKVGQLEPYQVIGSRIRRLDEEIVAPVVSTTREEIELSGFQNLGEFVRQLSFGSSTSVDPQFGTGLASGATSINLRGLGPNNTLVLINGRRAAPYGLAGGTGYTTLFDFNSVPLAAVDRVEILKDGASALYGSDAVAGVVNIRLRTNYNGFTIAGLYGNTTDTDSALRSFNATWGAAKGATSLLIVADWQTRHSLFLRDRDFSRTPDGRSVGGQDLRSSSGFPGYVVVPVRDAAGRTPPAGTITATTISPQGVLLTNPTVADFSRNASLYNFNDETTMLPDYTSTGLYARVRQEINARLHAFGEFSFRKNTSDFRQAATPVVNTNEGGTGTSGMRLPFDNPYNPFGVDIDNFRFRLVALGPRIRDTESTTVRYLGGLGGSLGLRDWTWQSGVLFSENKIAVQEFNWAADAGVQAALNQTSRATALNPFGPSAPGVVESLATTLRRRAIANVRQGDLQATGHIPGRLPGGELGIAIGVEHRRESFRDRPDPLAASGGVVGTLGTSGLTGFRRVSAGYVELSLPLARNFELQLAGRHEDYSDFGTTDKPKVGGKWRAAKWLLLRGSYSRSFRAPDLTQLFTARTVIFTNSAITDPLRPNDPPNVVRRIDGGNPNLQPELTDSYYAGAVLEFSRIKGLELAVDAWRFRQENLISQLSVATVLDLETKNPTGGVTRNPPTGDGLPGTINSIASSFFNVATAKTDGIDLSVRYTRPVGNSRIGFNATVTYLHSYEFNDFELVKTNAFPMFRGHALIHWTKGPWTASARGGYLDGYAEGSSSVFAPGRPAAHRIGHHYTVSPQVSYNTPWKMRITLGANNVFDRAPPYAFGKNELYDNLQTSGEGRFVFVRVTRNF